MRSFVMARLATVRPSFRTAQDLIDYKVVSTIRDLNSRLKQGLEGVKSLIDSLESAFASRCAKKALLAGLQANSLR